MTGYLTLFLLLSAFGSSAVTTTVKAEATAAEGRTAVLSPEIRDIETEVKLDADGDAVVIQKWDVTVTEGTEWYIPVSNPGKSRIVEFCVIEDGEEFVNEGYGWNSTRSLEEKAGRCGIIRKEKDDIELCWGLGSYGDHVFYVLYIIQNLVQDYGDCDAFHWHFLNDEWSVLPRHASITFTNETGTDPEVGLWKQYMVMAAAMGIADKVARNFEKLFPKVMEEYSRESNMVDMATTFKVIRNLDVTSSAILSSAVDRSEDRRVRAAQSRHYSGGGGSISRGGGRGGYGGGHGGGAR